MPIVPLPQFEADLEEHDRRIYESLKPPSSIVVRFGLMKMVGEFPYSGDVKPGCGSKIVVKTHRGVELGEMLTSTCPNAGCSKSVTRQEMLEYIENSGGREYPFFSMQGKVLRIATAEDLNEQARIEALRPQLTRSARAASQRYGLNMKVVDSEPILGGEKLTFYFTSEDRIDFRELVNDLAAEHRTRIEMRQVGARDEARLVADYERCGQHCCCKQFLKVLKPISMKSAKIQKATLDPLKISGRCGRLMCCLRYEDQTYDELRARLPRKKSRVKTPDGWGTVLDGQILTQLVLVLLDSSNEQVAIAVEDLEDPATAGPPPPVPPPPAYGPDTSRRPPRPIGSAPSGTAPGSGPVPGSADRDGSRPPTGRPDRDRRGGSRGPAPQPPRPRPERRDDAAATPDADIFDDIETDLGEGGGRPRPGRGQGGGGPGTSGPARGRDGRTQPRPADRPPPRDRPRDQRPADAAPPSPRSADAGDPLDDFGEVDLGDGPGGPTSGGGPSGTGGGGGGGSRKRRRRRRRGGGGGGGGGGSGGQPDSGGSSPE